MLQEAVDDFIAGLSSGEFEHGVTSRNTLIAYKNDLYQLCAYLEVQQVFNWSQVSREHLVLYFQAMDEQRSYRSTTLARKFYALKSFFRFMHSSVGVALEPIEQLTLPMREKEWPQPLSSEQVACLFQQMKADTLTGLRDLAMCQILYATGIHASELISLNIAHFDSRRSLLLCPGRWGAINRELPLPPAALEAITGYLKQAHPHLVRHTGEQALFLNHHGERLTRQGFWLIMKQYACRAGITDLTPYLLRHSFVVLMLKRGMTLNAIQGLLGHARSSTLLQYSQLACHPSPPA